MAVRMAGLDFAAATQQLAHVPRHLDLAGMGPGLVDPGIVGRRGSPEGFQAEGCDLVGQGHQGLQPGHGQAPEAGDELGAVDEGQALLGLQGDGPEAGRGQGLGAGDVPVPVPGQPLAHQQQGHVGQGRQVPGGPHAALGGHHGDDVPVQALGQQADGLGADPAVGLEQAVDAGGHEGPGLVDRQGLPHPGGVAADQVQLELGQLVLGDDHRRELSEAGVDPIDHPLLGQDPVDDRPVLGHRLQGGPIQGDGGPGGDAGEGLGGQALAIQADHGGLPVRGPAGNPAWPWKQGCTRLPSCIDMYVLPREPPCPPPAPPTPAATNPG